MQYLSYGSGSQSGGGNPRFIIFIGLMIVFLIMLPYFTGSRETPKEADDAAPPQTSAQAPSDVPSLRILHPIETRTIETDEYQLTMTNAGGGRVQGFIIKVPDRYTKHGDFIRSQKPAVESQGGLLPFEMTLPAFGLTPETQFALVSDVNDMRAIRFAYVDPTEHYHVEKVFRATDRPYILSAEVTLTNKTPQPLADTLAFSLFVSQIEGEEPGMFTPGAFVAAKCFTEGKLKYLDAKAKDKEEKYKKDIQWIAVDESYFAIALRTDTAEGCEISNDDGLLRSKLLVPVSIGAQASATYTFEIYMGPKEAIYLETFGRNLPAIIDYGWIEVLAKPMSWLLTQFHHWTGNWGIAIIFLTLIVRALLWPVAHKSQVSMMRMARIAPLMKEIQEKYKGDPATMQQKQMELYKTHKINPFGCLPLLLQMPVFFALYRCIFVTGGLYNAPFIWWIQDLSSPDPYFILPVLAVVLILVQQLLAPTATKSVQQKVMLYSIPIVFGVMMLFLPSGLCLYMVVSSGVSMFQSMLVRRSFAKEDALKAAETAATADVTPDELSSKDRRASKRRQKTS
ncbi:MAG: membrane protein insertase YidC [Proteobacteria bacterium]|nr:membrane protein insertase YidC [Pseudomonadota bacterium]